MTDLYRANYDRVAHDHLTHWRATGSNPFMSDDEVQTFDDATRTLLRRLLPAGSKILDAGCGMGGVLAECPEYDRHGIDLSAEYLEVAASRGIQTTQGDVEALPYPDETFEAVLALDLLEHVLDLNATVRELLRVLRPGGLLIARSPDREDLSGYVNYTVYDFVHLRRFDEATFRLLFTKVFGCSVIECETVGTELLVTVRK